MARQGADAHLVLVNCNEWQPEILPGGKDGKDGKDGDPQRRLGVLQCAANVVLKRGAAHLGKISFS